MTELEFEEDVRAVLTSKDRASVVRQLRCEKDLTWRQLANQCHYQWGAAWMPPDNQLAGRTLCCVAAEMLGEDVSKEPWE